MIKNILNAIRLADLDGAKTVEVEVSDLVTLANCIGEQEKQLDKLGRHFNSLLAQSLAKKKSIKRLNEYA